MSKAIIKAAETVSSLENKANLTAHEAVLLANAAIKLESRTLSNVYKTICGSEFTAVKTAMAVLYPSGNYPSFSDFAKSAKALCGSDRLVWSVWQGLRSMKALSPVAQAEKKIAKQGGQIVTTTDAVRAKAQSAAAAAKGAKKAQTAAKAK